MRTAELTGAALDWAVAKCEGEEYRDRMEWDGIGQDYPAHKYSTDWAQSGPIIDKEDIGFIKCKPLYFPKGDAKGVLGCDYYQPYIKAVIGVNAEYGPTPLIAAMRCYVASKLGDEVEILPELI